MKLYLLTLAAVLAANTWAATPDYQQIVKNGEFSFKLPFSMGTTFQDFNIDTATTGFAVAMSQPTGTSAVDATFTVPAGKVGVLTCNTVNHASGFNGFYVGLDDETLYKTPMGFVTADVEKNIFSIVNPGTHVMALQWTLTNEYDDPQYGYFYNLSLDLIDGGDNAAYLLTPNVDMGECYAQGKATVSLLNLGVNNLSLLSATDSEHFSVEANDASVANGGNLDVTINFAAEEIGTYEETVTLETTAGSYNVVCKASVIALPYPYSAIVTNGDFVFNTSVAYPFIVDEGGNEAYSGTAMLTEGFNFSDPLSSWLSASFTVPEGATATLSWNGTNSSGPLNDNIVTGQKSLRDGTEISLDGTVLAIFGGVNEDCSSSAPAIDKKKLTLGEGTHTVMFRYQKMTMAPQGEDKVTIKNLNLIVDVPTGVQSLQQQPMKAECYNLDGKRLDAPRRGVNIIRTTNGQGKVVTKKVVK